MHTACVIVTYNRLGLLKGTFRAVSQQSLPPDTIIVVDNLSTDGTRIWLSETASSRNDLVPLLMDKNYGGAGGFHYGIRKAYDMGADWIWTMDDDSLPAPDALEKLINRGIDASKAAARNVGFLASQVNWVDGSRHRMNIPGPAIDWNSGHDLCPGSVRIRYSSFVSILINRNAVKRVGLPIKEFFIYCDDVEYTRRITSAGFAAFYIESSKVKHLTAANVGVTMENIVKPPFDLNKKLYLIRNLIAVNKREKYGSLKETARLIYILAKSILHRLPLQIQLSLMVAGLRGLGLDYEKWIEYPLPMEKES